MKMTPQQIKAQENMKPGKITADGFLGDDDRNIVDIIQEDETNFARLGIDFNEVAELMRKLMKEGLKGLGEPIVYEKWEIRVDEARGFLPCPYQDGIFRKRVATVRNLRNDEQIIFSDLSIHLLEKHHFLQGKGSKFRIEPEKIKKVFYD
ncbi:hypothetical protein [Pseudothermotoga sp.]|nr:hypothetical protein [Pseudothermotoga sp.]MDW8139447.1 hypothetical protein [Pseudothermotoga sp.]